MNSFCNKLLATAAAFIVAPSMAQAGTGTASGTATMSVMSQCSITGATVSLGTYSTNTTWATVGAALGQYSTISGSYTPGTRGTEYLKFGSVTCDPGQSFAVSIRGTGTNAASGAIMITLNGKVAVFIQAIKRIGSDVVADNVISNPGAGAVLFNGPASGTGTGSAQDLLGSAIFGLGYPGSTVVGTDTLGAATTASDPLTYTLTF